MCKCKASSLILGLGEFASLLTLHHEKWNNTTSLYEAIHHIIMYPIYMVGERGEREHSLACNPCKHHCSCMVVSCKNMFPIVFRLPVITGETTLNEGDTLDLDCDVSTSSPLPSVQWFSPQGDLISNSSDLEIMNIQRTAMGVYTCVATQSGATLNISVNVIVQCECYQ